ncbi:MAG TPA: serpin family protein [Micromonosporaceae bacterium]|nr:serpin family protein [Micromonosporaceae bacterium]
MHRPHLDFALDLHDRLAPTGNLVWSPYSVAAALGLAAAGARGATREELARVLAPGGGIDDLANMLTRSATPRDAEIAVANALWTRTGLPLRDAYRQTVLRLPGGALHATDFAGDPERSRIAINADVAETTRGLITDLLAPGRITRSMVAVIVNALYLKVAWANRFAASATGPAPFRAPSGIRQVSTMHQQERMGYAAAGHWRMVTMRTFGEVVVDILLPTGDPPLTAETVVALREAAAATTVDLALPAFRVKVSTTLKDPLSRLGVTTAFTTRADFSEITDGDPIVIDEVVHEAVLRVDEDGFEGAAATAVIMRMTSYQMGRPVEFHVDRPFVIIVRHPETGAIYFLGRITEP